MMRSYLLAVTVLLIFGPVAGAQQIGRTYLFTLAGGEEVLGIARNVVPGERVDLVREDDGRPVTILLKETVFMREMVRPSQLAIAAGYAQLNNPALHIRAEYEIINHFAVLAGLNQGLDSGFDELGAWIGLRGYVLKPRALVRPFADLYYGSNAYWEYRGHIGYWDFSATQDNFNFMKLSEKYLSELNSKGISLGIGLSLKFTENGMVGIDAAVRYCVSTSVLKDIDRMNDIIEAENNRRVQRNVEKLDEIAHPSSIGFSFAFKAFF